MYLNFFKRFFDFIIAVIALIILSPFLIPISLILLLTGEHEVLYLQKRVGFKVQNMEICYHDEKLIQNGNWQLNCSQ